MKHPIRLLLVGPLPPPSGGMGNQTRQLKRLLEGEGLQVALVQTNAPYWPVWVSSLLGVRAIFRLVPFLRDLWIEAGRADVVHVMANSGWAWFLMAAPGIWIAKWRDRPVIVNYRGGLAREFLEKCGSIVVAALRDTNLVVPSRFLREVFAERSIAAEIIPNIVDTDQFRPLTKVRRPRDGGAPHVVIARNLETIYGIDIALRALSLLRERIPGLRASIAGSGPERGALEALAEDLGLSNCVCFTGRLEVAQMVELYQTADVVLNPVRADNTPNSILEALACGVPVVSTSVGGVPYLVEHGRTALLVRPESPPEMAEALQRVLGDADLKGTLVLNGLDLASGCSWPVVKERWLSLYRRLTLAKSVGEEMSDSER